MSNARTQAFELKGSLYPMTALRLTCADADAVAADLREQVARAPDFLRDAPIVLDLSRLDALPDLRALQQAARDVGLHPVGVTGPQAELKVAARAADLPVFSGRAAKAQTQPQEPRAPHSEPEPAPRPKVVTQTVRSGQQIYASGTDLIVLASVNRDAEVLADGHVHIYGSLQGKAMAGAQGDASARIFAQALDPQLVSVAGVYSAGEDLKFDFQGRAGHVRLDDHRLRIEPL